MPKEDIEPKGHDLEDSLLANLQLLNAEVTRRVDGQALLATQLDTKAAAMMTLSLTGAGLFIAQGRSVAGGLAVAGFMVAVVLGVACLAVRNFTETPPPRFGATFEHEREVVTLDRLVRAKGRAYEKNRETMDAKAEWLKIMTWWMSLPVAAAVTSFYVKGS